MSAYDRYEKTRKLLLPKQLEPDDLTFEATIPGTIDYQIERIKDELDDVLLKHHSHQLGFEDEMDDNEP